MHAGSAEVAGFSSVIVLPTLPLCVEEHLHSALGVSTCPQVPCVHKQRQVPEPSWCSGSALEGPAIGPPLSMALPALLHPQSVRRRGLQPRCFTPSPGEICSSRGGFPLQKYPILMDYVAAARKRQSRSCSPASGTRGFSANLCLESCLNVKEHDFFPPLCTVRIIVSSTAKKHIVLHREKP